MNLGELRTSLQDKGYATDTAASQTRMLNSIYRRIAGEHRWPWLDRQSTALATVAGNQSVTLTAVTSLMWVDAVRLEYGTEYPEVKFLAPQALRDMAHVDRSTGTPRFWTEEFGELRFWPTPDKAYTVVLDYMTTPPDLAVDADIPLFDSTYHDVLVWGAIAEMAFRERDWSAKNFAAAEYADRYGEMKRTYGIRQRQNATHVARAKFWDNIGSNTDWVQ